MQSADPPHAAAWRHVRPNSSTQSTFKFGISATSFLKQSRKPFIAAIWIGSIPWEPGLYKNYFIILHNSGTTKQRTLITMKSTFSDELETVLNISLIILAYDTTMLQCHENSSWDFSPIYVTTKQQANISNSFQVTAHRQTSTPLSNASYMYMHVFTNNFCHAVLWISAAYAIMRCPSVRLSITFMYSVKMSKCIIKLFKRLTLR